MLNINLSETLWQRFVYWLPYIPSRVLATSALCSSPSHGQRTRMCFICGRSYQESWNEQEAGHNSFVLSFAPCIWRKESFAKGPGCKQFLVGNPTRIYRFCASMANKALGTILMNLNELCQKYSCASESTMHINRVQGGRGTFRSSEAL